MYDAVIGKVKYWKALFRFRDTGVRLLSVRVSSASLPLHFTFSST